MTTKKLSIDVDSLGRECEGHLKEERDALERAPKRFKAGEAVEDVDPKKEDLGD